MIVEAAVLDGDDRLGHPRRDGGERHVAALFAPLGDERREQRRIELDRVQRLFPSDDLDGLQTAAPGSPVQRVGARRRALLRRRTRDHRGKHQPHRLPWTIAASRNDGQGVAADGEFSGLSGLRALRVPEIVESVDHLRLRDALAAPDQERTGEDARVRPLELPVHPRVDHPRELDVVITDEDGSEEERDADRQDGIELPAAPAQEGHSRA